jgi:hypothetical protein
VNGRLVLVVVAIGASAVSLTAWGVLSWLGDGRIRSILTVPIWLIYFMGLCALISSVFELIFGDDDWTRLSYLFVAFCAGVFGAGLLALASRVDHAGGVLHGLAIGLRFFGMAAIWVLIGCGLAAIFGKLPEIEMAEGD